VCVCVYVYVCVFIYIYIYIYVYSVCVCVRVCVMCAVSYGSIIGIDDTKSLMRMHQHNTAVTSMFRV